MNQKKATKNHKEGIGSQQSNLAAILCKNSKQLKSPNSPIKISFAITKLSHKIGNRFPSTVHDRFYS